MTFDKNNKNNIKYINNKEEFVKEKRVKERRGEENRRASVRFGDALGRRKGIDRRGHVTV